jgi:magnesium chelatase family protein
MALARTYSVGLVGVQGHVVEVETDIANGLPAMVLVGLPDTALREARDRIRAAICNSGADWPQTRVTVGLSPASLPKRGSGFDLAIAVGVLAAAGKVPLDAIEPVMFLSELGLDGQLRPVHGVLPAVVTAAACGLRTVVVAEGNAAEAALVPGVRIVPASHLMHVLVWLRGGSRPPLAPPGETAEHVMTPRTPKDMSEVLGQAEARRAVEVCAAGGHNLSLLGPPGAGKTMLAERMPSILPKLDASAALEVTSIHSVAGMLSAGAGLVSEPPFCAPHHTASKAAIVGGGSGLIRPGAASLAHLGILFLDEAPEFQRDVLDALRQPLESGEVVIARSAMCARFPARFSLVLASNPCPCARAAAPGAPPAASAAGCSCSPAQVRRYQAKLSGPLLDRVDVKVQLEPVTRADILHDKLGAEPSSAVAARVSAARERAARRLRDTQWRVNAQVPGSQLRRTYPVAPGALAWLDRAMENGQLSARGADKVVRVSWTLADLAGKDRPGSDEVNKAIGLWLGIPRLGVPR